MENSLHTSCCIAGGGPAGVMLGFLLARAGVDVVVLEKHADFLRDFRGDTIHPSTLELMYELGILEEFLLRPHQEIRELSAQIGNENTPIADFTHLPTHCKFLALMPQWDFLNFIAGQAQRYPSFHLKMQAEVIGLLTAQGKVVGVQAKTQDGLLEIRASLTVGVDGRHSRVRECAELEVIDLGAPMDVMWMRISRQAGDPQQTFGHADRGKILIMLNRDEYWQCAYVIPKGAADEIRQSGLEAFRDEISGLEPFFRNRMHELRDWNDVSLLTVKVDRLAQWSKPGLLCIGDAAHAMSPIGGVGINLAIQDAVATANLLAPRLLRNAVSAADLRRVQRRRSFPTRAIQRLQILIQNKVVVRVLAKRNASTFPWPLKMLRRWPMLRRIPARIVGMGFRPEHVKRRSSVIRQT
jgi:2-polyprenyl-6-methoxyphenol hydroxylase-like FAD-dependent oxidoreductase